jgi:aminomethyltransferase
MLKHTPLYEQQLKQNARMVHFADWEMPLHFGSQLEEHRAVRQLVGLFDVSHMGIVDITGIESWDFLRYLLANDIDRLKISGKALYSCMLNQEAGILDDLIVYWLGQDRYRLIINAGTIKKDMDWMGLIAKKYKVEIRLRNDLAMLALQGPKTIDILLPQLRDHCQEQVKALKKFSAIQCVEVFIARTGYTGEDGVEIILPEKAAKTLWQTLCDSGIQACGLGARDSLRLEAGLNLYGIDMDENNTPLESGLGWTVAWDPPERNFIGRKALEDFRIQGNLKSFVGLAMEDKGVLRNGMLVLKNGHCVGRITSGGYSPNLDRAIALARLEAKVEGPFEVEIRGRRHILNTVPLPFVPKAAI